MSLRLQQFCIPSSYGGHRCFVSSLHFVPRQSIKNGLMDEIQSYCVDVAGCQGVPYFNVTLSSHVLKSVLSLWFFFSIEYIENTLRNFITLSLSFFVSREYLKNGLMDSIQIWLVVLTGFQGVPYSKVTLNFQILHVSVTGHRLSAIQ